MRSDYEECGDDDFNCDDAIARVMELDGRDRGTELFQAAMRAFENTLHSEGIPIDLEDPDIAHQLQHWFKGLVGGMVEESEDELEETAHRWVVAGISAAIPGEQEGSMNEGELREEDLDGLEALNEQVAVRGVVAMPGLGSRVAALAIATLEKEVVGAIAANKAVQLDELDKSFAVGVGVLSTIRHLTMTLRKVPNAGQGLVLAVWILAREIASQGADEADAESADVLSRLFAASKRASRSRGGKQA